MALKLDSYDGKQLRRGISAADASLWLERAKYADLSNRYGAYNGPYNPNDQNQARQIASVDNIIRATQSGGAGRRGGIFADEEDKARYASEDADSAAQAQQEKIQKNADVLSGQAKDFRNNLPNYINSQTDPLVDQSKRSLVNDIYKVKQNASARGLLNSGINEGNQAEARAFESSQLAKGIQDVNVRANSQADYRDQLAANAQSGAEGGAVQLAQYQATQAQTAYEQALQKQAAENSFWGSLFGGLATAGAIVASGGLAAPAAAPKALAGGIPV